MAKPPKPEVQQNAPDVWRDAVLKRMLETPPKPFTPKAKKKSQKPTKAKP